MMILLMGLLENILFIFSTIIKSNIMFSKCIIKLSVYQGLS